jgi:hypothetical protein
VGAEDFCVMHFCGAVIARPIGTAEGKRSDRCRTSERGKSGSGAINGMPFGTMSIGAIEAHTIVQTEQTYEQARHDSARALD